MTDEMMSLQNLLGKSADADFLREMIGFAAQRLMELEVGALRVVRRGRRRAARSVSSLSWPRRRRSRCPIDGCRWTPAT